MAQFKDLVTQAERENNPTLLQYSALAKIGAASY